MSFLLDPKFTNFSANLQKIRDVGKSKKLIGMTKNSCLKIVSKVEKLKKKGFRDKQLAPNVGNFETFLYDSNQV